MNLQEFAKLAKGDKIENAMTSSSGEVTEVTAAGVRIRWGAAPTSPTYEYSVQSTAWFHWNKVDVPRCPNCDSVCRARYAHTKCGCTA